MSQVLAQSCLWIGGWIRMKESKQRHSELDTEDTQQHNPRQQLWSLLVNTVSETLCDNSALCCCLKLQVGVLLQWIVLHQARSYHSWLLYYIFDYSFRFLHLLPSDVLWNNVSSLGLDFRMGSESCLTCCWWPCHSYYLVFLGYSSMKALCGFNVGFGRSTSPVSNGSLLSLWVLLGLSLSFYPPHLRPGHCKNMTPEFKPQRPTSTDVTGRVSLFQSLRCSSLFRLRQLWLVVSVCIFNSFRAV